VVYFVGFRERESFMYLVGLYALVKLRGFEGFNS